MSRSYLLPGRIIISGDAAEICTNLGSCVSVVLHSPKKRMTAITHYVLPSPNEGQTPSHRFGTEAIRDALEALGGPDELVEAKIYGGANIFRGLTITKDIGELNVSIAFETLTALGIPIVEQNVGGVRARRVTVNPATFEVRHEFQDIASAAELDLSGFGVEKPPKRISVAVIDDNEDIRSLFEKIFQQNGLEVVGTAGDAYSARELIVKTRPMVVTLDIEMPGMSGVNFLKKLMTYFPTPVVMVSQLDSHGTEALKALQYGAVEFVQKPIDFDNNALREMATALVEKVRAAAFRRVTPPDRPRLAGKVPRKRTGNFRLAVVGGNIGSPMPLRRLLSRLGPGIPPIVVADSTIGYFTENFARSLPANGPRFVIPESGQRLESNVVYLVPKPFHGIVAADRGGLVLELKQDPHLARHAPSLNVLFGSAAKVLGPDVLAILLSSHGPDGLAGIDAIASQGGIVAVQSPEEAEYSQTLRQVIEGGLADVICEVEAMNDHFFPGTRKAA